MLRCHAARFAKAGQTASDKKRFDPKIKIVALPNQVTRCLRTLRALSNLLPARSLLSHRSIKDAARDGSCAHGNARTAHAKQLFKHAARTRTSGGRAREALVTGQFT